jgi:hypothetical protein
MPKGFVVGGRKTASTPAEQGQVLYFFYLYYKASESLFCIVPWHPPLSRPWGSPFQIFTFAPLRLSLAPRVRISSNAQALEQLLSIASPNGSPSSKSRSVVLLACPQMRPQNQQGSVYDL